MKRFFYHKKPVSMHGTELFPLNRLRSIRPDLYELELRKYEGREELMQRIIPKLDCLWNDVLHCSPLHPQYVYEGLREASAKPRESQWFKFPIEILSEIRTVIYTPFERSPVIEAANVQLFETSEYKELATLPDVTLVHYKSAVQEGTRPLMFIGCPHLLVFGSLDTQRGELIEIR